MPAAAFRRHRLPALACAAAVAVAGAMLPGIADSGARAQDRDCYRARSHVTGERVWVCRDARGQWDVAPDRRRLPQRGVARPSAPVIINRPLAAPAPPPPPRVSGRESGAGDALTAAALRADNLSLQRALNAVGCDAGRADGVWGAQSRRAARCFQRSIGAPLTGELTEDQVSWLRDLTRDQVAGLDSAPVDDGAVADDGADAGEDLDDDRDDLGAAGAQDALPDPVGLPDLRIDVSRERLRDGEAGHDARGDDPAEAVVLDDARDGAEAIADAWRSESDRLASVLSDNAAAPDAPRPDAPPKAAAPPSAPRVATPPPAPPPARPATAEQERTRARQAEIARLAPMLGLEPADLRAACRQGMRERQDEITPMVLMFNRVCRAHAYAENDDMLKLGYDARLAAAGDREAQQAMAERRKAAEAAQSGSDAARP